MHFQKRSVLKKPCDRQILFNLRVPRISNLNIDMTFFRKMKYILHITKRANQNYLKQEQIKEFIVLYLTNFEVNSWVLTNFKII